MRQQTAALLFVATAMFVLDGCATDGPKGLPGGAALVAEGSGPLVFTASDKGTVYVRDAQADRLVFQSPVEKGQRVEVDPAGNRVTLEGRQVSAPPLRSNVSYQIYMKRAEQREYHPMMNP
jgi:DNA-binding beta-propeller fold protein YncE